MVVLRPIFANVTAAIEMSHSLEVDIPIWEIAGQVDEESPFGGHL